MKAAKVQKQFDPLARHPNFEFKVRIKNFIFQIIYFVFRFVVGRRCTLILPTIPIKHSVQNNMKGRKWILWAGCFWHTVKRFYYLRQVKKKKKRKKSKIQDGSSLSTSIKIGNYTEKRPWLETHGWNETRLGFISSFTQCGGQSGCLQTRHPWNNSSVVCQFGEKKTLVHFLKSYLYFFQMNLWLFYSLCLVCIERTFLWIVLEVGLKTLFFFFCRSFPPASRLDFKKMSKKYFISAQQCSFQFVHFVSFSKVLSVNLQLIDPTLIMVSSLAFPSLSFPSPLCSLATSG